MPKLIDLTGKRFGKLTVLNRADKNKRKKPAWVCRCDCGNLIEIAGCELRQSDSKSCGCFRKSFRTIDLKGITFGKLKVLETTASKGTSTAKFWKCLCECGNFHIASSQHLRLGQIKSCGCWFKKPDKLLIEEAKERFFKHFEKSEGCWIWQGRIVKGYGVLFYKKNLGAHRFSYLIHKGKIEKGLLICHHCDNPLCVNPEHLYQGTPKQNTQDAYARKRMLVGEKHHYAKLKEEEVKLIFSSNAKGVDLATKYNVSEDTVSRIRTGKLWKSVNSSIGGTYRWHKK